MNDRWLRFPGDRAVGTDEDQLGVGVNYLDVCARVRGADAPTARRAASVLRSVLDGGQAQGVLGYRCVAPRAEWLYRMDVRTIGDHPSYALVAHTRLDAPGELGG